MPQDLLPFHLENGESLVQIEVAYETYGSLNDSKTNTILVCHAFSSDAQAAIWWKTMVGIGRPLDPEKFFIICSNVLGGCAGTTGPTSINPATGTVYGIDFPMPTIRDMVKIQALLLDFLGVPKLLAVIGGSMGGMQALEWSKTFPDRVRTSIILASTPRLSPQSIGFNVVGRNAIMRDPNWHSGRYQPGAGPRQGLAVARMVAHITFLSEEAMRTKFGRRTKKESLISPLAIGEEFEVEGYLWHQGEKFVDRFDANTYLLLTKAMDVYDFSEGYGNLEEAFSQTQSEFLIISFSSDWLFPTEQSKEMATSILRAGRQVTFQEIKTEAGHDSFLLPNTEMEGLIQSFLEARI